MPTYYTITLENLNDPIPIETTTLYCCCNKLQALPESIGNLNNLHLLYCDNNQLQALPESIGNLNNLHLLSCYNNQLQALPESIGNLNNLKYLYCENNQFTKEVNDIISKYSRFNNKAQKILQELRDAYLIPTDNSFILK
jgi:Leucine-rich repeat (LRR) protein